MHEQKLMTDLIRKIDQIVKRENATGVSRAEVTLGAMSHFSPEHFRRHFEQSAEGTAAEHARLTIRESTDRRAEFAQTVRLDRLELSI